MNSTWGIHEKVDGTKKNRLLCLYLVVLRPVWGEGVPMNGGELKDIAVGALDTANVHVVLLKRPLFSHAVPPWCSVQFGNAVSVSSLPPAAGLSDHSVKPGWPVYRTLTRAES